MKMISVRFLYDCFKKLLFLNFYFYFSLKNMFTIVNEGLSSTIVNETTNFIKIAIFEKNNYMQLYRMSSHMKVKSCGVAKTS